MRRASLLAWRPSSTMRRASSLVASASSLAHKALPRPVGVAAPPFRRPMLPRAMRRPVSTGVSHAAVASEAAVGAAASSSSSVAIALRSKVRLPLVGQLTLSELFGHTAFALAATAFLDPDILNLRLLSVASGAATLVFTYFHPVGRPLWLPFGWNVLFMGINAGHIYTILSERWQAERLPPQAVELWKTVFEHHGVSAVEFSKLLASGTWTTLRKGTALQAEGQPSASVILLVSGGADVSVAGKKTHRLTSHQFIGDMGLSSGITISQPVRGVATVTTNQQVRRACAGCHSPPPVDRGRSSPDSAAAPLFERRRLLTTAARAALPPACADDLPRLVARRAARAARARADALGRLPARHLGRRRAQASRPGPRAGGRRGRRLERRGRAVEGTVRALRSTSTAQHEHQLTRRALTPGLRGPLPPVLGTHCHASPRLSPRLAACALTRAAGTRRCSTRCSPTGRSRSSSATSSRNSARSTASRKRNTPRCSVASDGRLPSAPKPSRESSPPPSREPSSSPCGRHLPPRRPPRPLSAAPGVCSVSLHAGMRRACTPRSTRSTRRSSRRSRRPSSLRAIPRRLVMRAAAEAARRCCQTARRSCAARAGASRPAVRPSTSTPPRWDR